MTDILQIRDLNKSFGGIVVADNIDLDLRAGRVLGLIGPNGAGKTSLFNLVTGVLGGTITVDSEPGRGTRLVITMPVEPEGATQSGPLAALTVTNQGPPRLQD